MKYCNRAFDIIKMMNIIQSMKKNNINIMMLKTLVSLHETKSISNTAKELNVTQSAISHTVRALESAVEVPILIREPRGVELTVAGLKASKSASMALASIRDILQLANSTISGNVRLATVVSASRTIVPGVLKYIHKNYPDITVDLLIGTDQEVKHWVEHNIADIGLAYELDTQKSEVIFTDQYYAISSHNMSLPSKLTMPILSNEGFIMSSSGCEQAINNIFDQSDSQLNIKTTVSDMNALFAIVGSGYGISIVPGLAFPENWSEVVKRHSLSPQLKCTLSMQIPKKKKDQQFIEVLNIAIKQVAESLG